MAQSWTQVILVAIIKISCCAKILQQEPKEKTITSRFWSKSLPLLYTYKIKWIPKIIRRKIHVLFHTHIRTRNSLFLLPTLTHLQGPYSVSDQEVLQRWLAWLFHFYTLSFNSLHLTSFPLLRPFTWNSTIIQVALHLFSVRVLAPVL